MGCVTFCLACVCHRSKNWRNSGQGHARSCFIWQRFPWCGTEAQWDLLVHTYIHLVKKSHKPYCLPSTPGRAVRARGLVDCLFKQGQYMCTLLRMHKPTHAADTFTVYSMRSVYGPVLLPGSIPFIPILSSLTFTQS